MKTRLFVVAATLALGSIANAQNENLWKPNPSENKFYSSDSLLKQWGISKDSLAIKLEDLNGGKYDLKNGPFGGILDLEDGMLRGTLLDNSPMTTGYIQEGTKYYIRNVVPNVESKPIKDGSMFYWAK